MKFMRRMDYILKVCVREENEPQFNKETFLYEALKGKVAVPEFIAVDASKTLIHNYYMIYRKIEGEPLASHWHELTDEQRKELIGQFCEHLCLLLPSIVRNMPRYAVLTLILIGGNTIWHKSGNGRHLSLKNSLFSCESYEPIDEFVERYQHVLVPQQLAVTYWDVHFDNVLVDQR